MEAADDHERITSPGSRPATAAAECRIALSTTTPPSSATGSGATAADRGALTGEHAGRVARRIRARMLLLGTDIMDAMDTGYAQYPYGVKA
ncbi:MAG TPA: hypothetical protein VNW71_04195 [Thermoanaerobaculia bacterium]|nr:hypothetical protein [Thermoanaerobaculia bacterium]